MWTFESSISGNVFIAVLAILALDVWAIAKTLATSSSWPSKLVWSAIILMLPLIGLVIWSLAGPKVRKPEVYKHEPP